MAKTDVAKVYETLLSIPGMNDTIKLTFQASRRNVLLLHKIIERGIHGKDADEKSQAFFESASKDILKELSDIGSDLLNKAGLAEMNEKLKEL